MKDLIRYGEDEIRRLVEKDILDKRPELKTRLSNIVFRAEGHEPFMTPLGPMRSRTEVWAEVQVNTPPPPKPQKSKEQQQREYEEQLVVLNRCDWVDFKGDGKQKDIGTVHFFSQRMWRSKAHRLAELWKDPKNVRIALDYNDFDVDPEARLRNSADFYLAIREIDANGHVDMGHSSIVFDTRQLSKKERKELNDR